MDATRLLCRMCALLTITLTIHFGEWTPGAVVPETQTTLQNSDAILLVPPIAEAEHADRVRGVFYQGSVPVEVRSSVVRLAGTSDGQGDICTDDQATLTFVATDGREQIWTRTFADASHQAIVCLPPQTIPLEAGPGTYRVKVVLYDSYPFTYSSRPYYLLPVPAVAATMGVAATVASSPRLTTRAPTRTLSATAMPEASRSTQAALPTRTTVPSLVPVTPRRILAVGNGLLPVILLTALVLLLLGTLVLGRRRKPQALPGLTGIVDLRDRETGEVRTLLLHPYTHGGGITRFPLDLVALTPDALPPGVLATIVAAARGPLLCEQSDESDGVSTVLLIEGDHLLMQEVIEVRYRRS